MSEIARWSYQSLATVWPKLQATGGWKDTAAQYGTPYQIKCCWKVGAELTQGADAKQFISRCKYWHEDERVKLGDRIAKGAYDGTWQEAKADEIMAHDCDDMAMFDDPMPDYTTVV